jgi:hypothetical protein
MKVYSFKNRPTEDGGKVFTQPSLTVPDQTMSMRTMIERYAKGLPIGEGKEEIWDDDIDQTMGINPRTLDLVDIQELKLKNSEIIKKSKSDKH